MKAKWLIVGVLSAGLVGCASMKGEGKDEEKDETKITMDQVPAAVKATLDKESEGGQITEIEKESKDGKTIYEADTTTAGHKYEIKVAEDGTLQKKKLDDADDEKEEKGEHKD